jgi:hypothetical protein
MMTLMVISLWAASIGAIMQLMKTRRSVMSPFEDQRPFVAMTKSDDPTRQKPERHMFARKP